MKLISVKCPNCGSKLEFTPNSKTVTCEYCGYDIMVDDEVKRIKLDDAEQTGYDLGKGLHRALQEAGEEADNDPAKPPKNKEKLIQQLELLRAHFSQTADVEETLRKTQVKLEETKYNNKTGCLTGCLVAILLMALVLYLIVSDPSIKSFMSQVLMLIVVANCICSLFNASKRKNAERTIRECEQKIAENRASAPVKFVAPELCSIQYIDSILVMLRMGRADSYKEALNLFVQDIQNTRKLNN